MLFFFFGPQALVCPSYRKAPSISDEMPHATRDEFEQSMAIGVPFSTSLWLLIFCFVFKNFFDRFGILKVIAISFPSSRSCEKMSLQCCNPSCQKKWTLRCTACESVGYCGTECQKIHWQQGHKTDCKAIVEEKKKKKQKELIDAIDVGDLERVQVLIEQGADKDERGGDCSLTPLYAATYKGHLHVVRYLVELGAKIEKATSDGETPLMAASQQDHLETMRYLLEQGANTNVSNGNRETMLHWAANNGNLEAAKLLMVYGAKLNKRECHGDRPIDWATSEEMKQAIRDEPERRRDQQPRKRCVEQDHQPNAATSASAQQDGEKEEEQDSKCPRLQGGEAEEGVVADEDQDSEPSSDEEGN